MLSEEDYKVYELELSFIDYIKEMGYAMEQGTKPQTVGAALNDSPVGLLAYIIEKFYGWSDCKGNIETKFTKEDLLNNVMIYWTSGCVTTSLNYYFECYHSGDLLKIHSIYVKVPTAGIVFPKEFRLALKSASEYYYNIQRWTVSNTGGHFASLEEPEFLVKDIREFRKQLSNTNDKKEL